MVFITGEYPFPSALEEFRRRRFGAECVERLQPHEALYEGSLEEQRNLLSPIGRVLRPRMTYWAIERYLDFVAVSDPGAIAVKRRWELERARRASGKGGIRAEELQERLASEALAAASSSELPARRAAFDAQWAAAKEEMQKALINGRLRFWVLDHNSAETPGPGNPAFWRTDAAAKVWAGHRHGDLSAFVREVDLEAYFAAHNAQAEVIDRELSTPRTLALEEEGTAAEQARAPPEVTAQSDPFACGNKTAWLCEQLGGSFEGKWLSAPEYREIAKKLAVKNDASPTDDELGAEGRRLRAIHVQMNPKGQRKPAPSAR